MISAHQQGTVRFAASERDGGADLNGQVYGTRDVYVFDSSGYPTSAASHTMTPIIASSRMLHTISVLDSHKTDSLSTRLSVLSSEGPRTNLKGN